jgi:ferric iron reductase protein FhuF
MSISETLVYNNNIELLMMLLGKMSKLYDDETKAMHQITLINKLLRNRSNNKLCDTLCTKFGIGVDAFPEIVYEKKKGSIMFFLYSYLRKKPSNP